MATPNINLTTTPQSDTTTTFREWRLALNSPDTSNATKIDSAIGELTTALAEEVSNREIADTGISEDLSASINTLNEAIGALSDQMEAESTNYVAYNNSDGAMVSDLADYAESYGWNYVAFTGAAANVPAQMKNGALRYYGILIVPKNGDMLLIGARQNYNLSSVRAPIYTYKGDYNSSDGTVNWTLIGESVYDSDAGAYTYYHANADGGFSAGLSSSADTGAAIGSGAKASILNDTYGGGAAIGEGATVVGSGFAGGNSASSNNGGGAIGRNATATSGGAVGSGSSETSGGFAGGYDAHSLNGGAVGRGASADEGGAIGWTAKTNNGGAVGGDASSDTGGAVGEGANTKDGGAIGESAASTSGFAGGNGATTDTGAAIGFNAKAEILDDTYGGGVAAGENSHVVGSGAAIGSGAEATNGGVALGRNASTESGASIGSEAQSINGFAGGYSAKSTGMGSASGATANAYHGGAVGYAAEAQNGFAGGSEAKCGSVDCIQLGTGTNGNEKTLQVYDKQITDSSGNLVDVGALSDLSTTAKGTIVSAINELANAAGTAELNKLYVNYDPDTDPTDWNVVVSGGTKALAVGVSNTSANTADWTSDHSHFANDASGLYISESESSGTDQSGSAVYLDSQTSVDITALDAIDITSGNNMSVEVNGNDGLNITTTDKVVTDAGSSIYADAQSHVGIRGVDESYFVRGSVSAEDANTGASTYLEAGTLKGLVLDDSETYLEDVNGTLNIVGNKLYLTNKSSTASMQLTSGENIDLNIPSGNTVKVVGGDFRGDNSNVIKAFSQLRLGLNAHKDSDLTDTTSNPVMISVGNGADSDNRSEAMTLYYDGTVEFGGNVYANGELLGSGTSEYAFTEITAEDIEALLA